MKLPFTICDLRFAIEKQSLPPANVPARASAANRQSAIGNRKSEQGIALVITLIMLSVTLIMAVAFLAISRRERNAVTTTTATATARLAADAALASAEAQIAATILATTNLAAYNFNLFVSTNYVNANNTYFDNSGNLLFGIPFEQSATNQWILPRAPVAIYNRTTGTNEFRYFLDLNRNGRFETNGVVGEFNGAGVFTGNQVTEVGDPEWIGVLERPDATHGPNNKFVARYAFLAQPIGNGLDLNAIHNAARLPSQPSFASLGGDFLRNQGVGSWEINLGAFLNDLNTNAYAWDATTYNYDPLGGFVGGGGFADAAAMYAYRLNGLHTGVNDYAYNPAVLKLKSINNLFGTTGNNIFGSDLVDGYTDGLLMTTNALPLDNDGSDINYPWPGADNPDHFFALPSDLFDTNKTSASFTNRLQLAGGGLSTYDRYTFYRLLDQLGTDSAADTGKMNLNYRNVTNGVVVTGMETNFYAWTPVEFFTNAADRMLRAYTAQWASNYVNGAPQPNRNFLATFNTNAPFGVGNIPVLVSNQWVYSPAVNRLLQLAANLYDATTNKSAAFGKDYPSVFRPVFSRIGKDVYITGYREVSSLSSLAVGSPPLDPPLDVSDPALVLDAGVSAANGNVYGVPWIIGAKKGFPNFNQFHMRNAVQVTRKLQVTRTNPFKPGALETNQMFVMSITNQLGFSFWNSYDQGYTNSVGNFNIVVRDALSMVLSNGANANLVNKSTVYFTNLNGTVWPGSAWSADNSVWDQKIPSPSSFVYRAWDFPFLPESIYRATAVKFEPVNSPTAPLWEIGNTAVPVFPEFKLLTTNQLQAYILDGNHVIDYVQLDGPTGVRDLSEEIRDKAAASTGVEMWLTNAFGLNPASPTPTWGVVNQLSVSRKGNPPVLNSWKTPPNVPTDMNTRTAEAAFFNGFFTATYNYVNNKGKLIVGAVNTNLAQQAPYTPTRTAWEYTLWQANDPLVHYLATDLSTVNTNATGHSDDLITYAMPLTVMDAPGVRYQPWGRASQMNELGNTKVDTSGYNIAFRDSLVWGSDFWDFPAHKLPTAGWVGRVHRGTPWQSVFLKATNVLMEPVNALNNEPIGTNTWQYWMGDINNWFDAANAAPAQDAALFDLFTTSLNGNATRGTLSINQSGLAAWSALFGGVVALTNLTDFPTISTVPSIGNTIIPPAGVDTANSALRYLVDNINATRRTFVNANGLVGAFTRVGDILQVPALTQDSPFLNRSSADYLQYDIPDALYEWLPQQTLGLLRVGTPRYVIYCYGQALKPAPNGLVTTANNFGLVTNYQVVAESAARAVIRVDNATSGDAPRIVVESYNVLPPD